MFPLPEMVLMIPLLDTLRVFGIRIFHRRSPFSPDRNHIHHLLLDNGCSHKTITFILLAINIAVVGLAYLGRRLGCTILVLAVLLLFFCLIAVFYYARTKSRLVIAKVSKPDDANAELKASKLVPFAKDAILEQKN